MRAIVAVVIVLSLSGCSMTPAQVAQMNQQLRSFNSGMQPYQFQPLQQPVYDTAPPAAMVPAMGSGQRQQFLINTPSGLQRQTCLRNSSNYVYCY